MYCYCIHVYTVYERLIVYLLTPLTLCWLEAVSFTTGELLHTNETFISEFLEILKRTQSDRKKVSLIRLYHLELLEEKKPCQVSCWI